MREKLLVCVYVACVCVCASTAASVIADAAVLGWPLSPGNLSAAVLIGAAYGGCGGVLLGVVSAFLQKGVRLWVAVTGVILLVGFVFFAACTLTSRMVGA